MILNKVQVIIKCPKCLSEKYFTKNNTSICDDCNFTIIESNSRSIPTYLQWYAKEIDSIFDRVLYNKKVKGKE
jgi:hypothetical protein